jgi:uncharacterized protein
MSSWRLPRGLPYIGIVSGRRSLDGARPLMIHDIGLGAHEEDVLFARRVADGDAEPAIT